MLFIKPFSSSNMEEVMNKIVGIHRDQAIDMLKGISILSIMLLHYEQGVFPEWLNIWIGNFMITAFYFVIGWVESSGKDDTFHEKVKKRWRSLGIPYLWFSALLIIFSIIFWSIGHYSFKIVLRDIYKTLTLRGIGTLWFLPALFGSEVIAWKFRHSKFDGKVIITVISIVISCLYAYWKHTFAYGGEIWRMLDAPFRVINDMLNGWFVIIIGYYLGKQYSKELADMHKGKKIVLSIMILIWYTLCIFGVENARGWAFIASSLGPFGLLLLCQTVDFIPFLSGLSWFGRNSLIIMATHYSVLEEICIFINVRFGNGSEILDGWLSLIYFSFSLLVEILIIKLGKQYIEYVLFSIYQHKK